MVALELHMDFLLFRVVESCFLLRPSIREPVAHKTSVEGWEAQLLSPSTMSCLTAHTMDHSHHLDQTGMVSTERLVKYDNEVLDGSESEQVGEYFD